MKILETERLALRLVCETDAAFILDLLNQPSFIKFIGDRGIRTIADAEHYIETRFVASFEEHGYTLYLVELKENAASVGLCGFVKRENLPDADIGFAFLPQYCGNGYAAESADAVMKFGRDVLKFKKVLAITTKDNQSSGKLLEKIGFKFDRLITIPDEDQELKLFSSGQIL